MKEEIEDEEVVVFTVKKSIVIKINLTDLHHCKKQGLYYIDFQHLQNTHLLQSYDI